MYFVFLVYSSERVTVNLVPANRPKEGSHFDLPIALGVMMLGSVPVHSEDTAYLGEVSLDGSINAVNGVLPLVLSLREVGIKNIVLPRGNAEEAAILEDINIIPVDNLTDAADYMSGMLEINTYKRKKTESLSSSMMDFSQVMGQESIKRAIVVGTSGNHGMLLMGGPGCGKSMMAKRIPTILPELTYEEMLEITGIYSVAGLLSSKHPIIRKRPFRNPHHTITTMGLVGGGAKPKPGELSLAHRGVLFLDELGEFNSKVIDALRQPVEDGVVRIRRNSEEMVFPTQTMIVIAANPCKCGNLWDDKRICTCSVQQLNSHRRKLMGPFADRIDMHIKVNPVQKERLIEMGSEMKWEDSASMRNKVEAVRKIQQERYENTIYKYNGDLDEAGIKRYCILDSAGSEMLAAAYEKYGLTMRAYSKLLKLSRTIADLDASDNIRIEHIAEALMYRVSMDCEV